MLKAEQDTWFTAKRASGSPLRLKAPNVYIFWDAFCLKKHTETSKIALNCKIVYQFKKNKK